MPRVITTLNHLKPRKEQGEKTCPFDLCFSNFKMNIELLQNKFSSFYDDIEYNSEQNYWENKKYKMIFNHEKNFTLEELKARYNQRINNLYEYIVNKDLYIYFLIATFEKISVRNAKKFISLIKDIRGDKNFSVVFINQYKKRKISFCKQIKIINVTNVERFKEINKNGSWSQELVTLESKNALIFYKKITAELLKIIK